MDPRICCALGVCCPPDGAAQKQALAGLLAEAAGQRVGELAEADWLRVAEKVLNIFGTRHGERWNELSGGTTSSEHELE